MTRTIVMAQSFAEETTKMPGGLKQKVMTFMGKFQRGVDGGLDLKPPKGARSPLVRTARVDDNYRAVLAAAGEDTYALISVRPHDDAYTFAGRLRIGVNRVTGGLDIIDESSLDHARQIAQAQLHEPPAGADASAGRTTPGVADIDSRLAAPPTDGTGEAVPPSTTSPDTDADPVTVALDADELESIGIDPPTAKALAGTVPVMRAEAVAEELPTAQGMALLDVIAGRPIEEIRADYAAPEPVDTTDLQAALRRPVSQMTFVDMEDAQAVQAAMSGPLEAWRVWLHPGQRAIADHSPWKGPFRVTGGAGTGKTVTALHRAAHLAREEGLTRATGSVFAPVLFVTYTRNLATTIDAQIAVLLGADADARARANVEVLNLDAVARRIADADPAWAEVVTKGRPATESEIQRCAALAVAGTDVEPSFLIEEWQDVVLASGVTIRDDYLRVPRSGRGHRLSRAQRNEVWGCVERLTSALTAERRYTWEQLRDLAARALVRWADESSAGRGATDAGGDEDFMARTGVHHLVIDEAQDLTPVHWRMLRALVPAGPDDLFIAGDAHQRIYGRPVPLSRFGIETRGRSRRLTINYRTSRQILNWSMGMADAEADDLDEGLDPLTGERSVFQGPAVDIPGSRGLPTDADQAMVAWVKEMVDEGMNPGDIAVLRRTRAAIPDALDLLEQAGIDAVEVKNTTDETRLADAVRVMTMHRAKGLEYTAVVIRDGVGTQLRLGGEAKTPEQKRLRNLYYVAATRARERLLVC